MKRILLIWNNFLEKHFANLLFFLHYFLSSYHYYQTFKNLKVFLDEATTKMLTAFLLTLTN